MHSLQRIFKRYNFQTKLINLIHILVPKKGTQRAKPYETLKTLELPFQFFKDQLASSKKNFLGIRNYDSLCFESFSWFTVFFEQFCEEKFWKKVWSMLKRKSSCWVFLSRNVIEQEHFFVLEESKIKRKRIRFWKRKPFYCAWVCYNGKIVVGQLFQTLVSQKRNEYKTIVSVLTCFSTKLRVMNRFEIFGFWKFCFVSFVFSCSEKNFSVVATQIERIFCSWESHVSCYP